MDCDQFTGIDSNVTSELHGVNKDYFSPLQQAGVLLTSNQHANAESSPYTVKKVALK